MTKQSAWQSEELSTTYLEGVRGAIPAAALQLEVIKKIVSLWCPAPGLLLDLGCGDGLLGRELLRHFPASKAVFADFSDHMLEAARQQINDPERATVLKLDFSSPEWRDELRAGSFDLVVSGFAIHHQPDSRKRQLYAEIFDLLRAPGVFLHLEHVASASPAVENLFDSFFVDHLLAYHARTDPQITRERVEQGYYNRPDKEENILAPVEAQCHWLRQTGFQDVDCFFKIFELAVFGGRKI